jgi:hypothetical protein
LQIQLYMSSQFYPEWRAAVANGTQRKPPPSAALELFFDGLPIDIADVCAPSLRRGHSDRLTALDVNGPDNCDARLLSPRARRHVPGDTPTLCLKIRVR